MLTVEDVKLYLRIDEDITEDDMFIDESISAAVTYIEQMTGKPYIDEP
ncbi:MAG: head-tail connector protein [Veillonella sp.]|nr:head-tail connector protein [Veillonella sp.]